MHELAAQYSVSAERIRQLEQNAHEKTSGDNRRLNFPDRAVIPPFLRYNPRMANLFITLASLSGMLAVAFGAFGAHALKGRLDDYALGVFETAVQYHFYHSLALLAVG